MHKQRLNELILDFVIAPAGPLLIKSGVESGADPTLPNMNFVRTRHATLGETVYIPGSSLKGVVRSHTERIIRTVLGDAPTVCCDPFDKELACGFRIKVDNLTTAQQYAQLCLACKIFGHMVQASRLATQDAYPLDPTAVKLETRHGVAIDRRSGGVAVGPFELEVATSGRFATRLRLYNFERWQVGLLALVLRDLSKQELPIGFGKSRGLGRVTACYHRLSLAYPGRFDADGHDFAQRWYGVGAFPGLGAAYGFQADDSGDLPESLQGRALHGSEWGKPTLVLGDVQRERTFDQLSDQEAQDAHHEIEAFMIEAVQAWADFANGQRGEHDG
jgi:CRISPR-associated RAMP protein (TIGR02581 family)